jgi:hypothetical protein
MIMESYDFESVYRSEMSALESGEKDPNNSVIDYFYHDK